MDLFIPNIDQACEITFDVIFTAVYLGHIEDQEPGYLLMTSLTCRYRVRNQFLDVSDISECGYNVMLRVRNRSLC